MKLDLFLYLVVRALSITVKLEIISQIATTKYCRIDSNCRKRIACFIYTRENQNYCMVLSIQRKVADMRRTLGHSPSSVKIARVKSMHFDYNGHFGRTFSLIFLDYPCLFTPKLPIPQK